MSQRCEGEKGTRPTFGSSVAPFRASYTLPLFISTQQFLLVNIRPEQTDENVFLWLVVWAGVSIRVLLGCLTQKLAYFRYHSRRVCFSFTDLRPAFACDFCSSRTDYIFSFGLCLNAAFHLHSEVRISKSQVGRFNGNTPRSRQRPATSPELAFKKGLPPVVGAPVIICLLELLFVAE